MLQLYGPECASQLTRYGNPNVLKASHKCTRGKRSDVTVQNIAERKIISNHNFRKTGYGLLYYFVTFMEITD
jgi:hypothetical protein